jgi:hypothetical protein
LADTTYIDNQPPTVNAAWLNDVNDFIYGNTARAVLITGGTILTTTINSSPIGATTPSTGAFTTLSTTGLATLNSFISSGADINGGNIDGAVIGGTSPAAAQFTTVATTGNVTLGNGATDSHTVNGGLSITRVSVTSPVATDGNVFSGTYTPTLTNGANVAASSAAVAAYTRIGNVVSVSGQLTIDPTAASTITELTMSLPVTVGNFSSSNQAGGMFCTTLAAASLQTDQGVIFSSTGATTVMWRFYPASSASNLYNYIFQYLIT